MSINFDSICASQRVRRPRICCLPAQVSYGKLCSLRRERLARSDCAFHRRAGWGQESSGTRGSCANSVPAWTILGLHSRLGIHWGQTLTVPAAIMGPDPGGFPDADLDVNTKSYKADALKVSAKWQYFELALPLFLLWGSDQGEAVEEPHQHFYPVLAMQTNPWAT